MAPSKESKNVSSFEKLQSKKKGKAGKKNAQGNDDKNTLDFSLIKQFNSLRLSAPLSDEDYEKSISDLQKLKEASIYWGKIIQR